MKPASIFEIKKELEHKSSSELKDICLRLVKHKKENKELITYLLFEADNEFDYIQIIKSEIDLQFAEMNMSNMYYVKKSARKILRYTNKFIKYSGLKRTEVELLLYYCNGLKNCGVSIKRSQALENLYQRQILKIQKSIKSLHEDLQYDYGKLLQQLT